MRIDNAVAADVLERMLSSYGFVMQKELAEHLGIAKSNVAGWLQRSQIPGNAIVQCALDTGADVNWLVTGELANASFNVGDKPNKGKPLLDEILASGGKAVLRRMLDAYGFSTQKELGDLLGISSGTISTWIRRDYFPGEVVIACALDTGISLQWLATGKGGEQSFTQNRCFGSLIPRKNLIAGMLQEAGTWEMDLSFIPYVINEPLFIFSNTESWIVDRSVDEISNGRWLIGIEEKFDVYDVYVLPGKNVKITKNSESFICKSNEISIEGKVALTLLLNS